MKRNVIFLVSTLLLLSCGKTSTLSEESGADTIKALSILPPSVSEESTRTIAAAAPETEEEPSPQRISTQGQVLSVQEELIMPSDYLTTAMVVATAEGDTLVFLDMGGFESLVGLEIPVSYSLQQGDQLLVCFDCTTHQGPIPLYDLTALPSEVEFARLQLEKYLPDPYINPAATYQMRREDGTLGDYYSNVENLIADSTRMASGFFSYGVVTKWHPQLRNREVLEQLLNDEID